jgi:hypothetical protein
MLPQSKSSKSSKSVQVLSKDALVSEAPAGLVFDEFARVRPHE